MSPRKPVNKTRVPSSLRDGDCGEEEDLDEEVKEILPEERPHSSFSSPQRRERVVKPKPREMTEEEMMDLALRLSEQEASMAAVKHQREEDAMREALKESMFSQTQPCALPPSQSYHGNTQPLPKLSRRKLAYPATAGQDAMPVEDLTAVPSPEPAWRGNHNNNSKRKRKREDRGPPPQRPDLPQTQKICSQDSEPEPLCPQDVPSTPTQPRRLAKTFTPPSTPSPPCVQLLRMNPGILQTCRTSGFVLCSPLSLTSTQTGPPSPSRSPTFPSGATHSDDAGRSKAPTFPQSTDCSDPDLEIVGETDPNLDSPSSPVFGRGESIMPLDDTGFAPKSPLFGRNVPTRASDCGAPTAAWDRGQRSPAPHGDQKEKLKASKLSHSKRRMYTESYCLSKGLTCPQSPLGVQVSPGGRLGGVEDGLEQSFSSPAEHCTTSPIFGKSAQAIGVTSPVFGEESPVLGNSSPPEMESGPGSPIFGRTSPLFGRTGANKTTSSPQGSAVNSKEARQPAPCPQKTNGLSHEDEESEPTPGAVRPTRAHLAGTEEQSRGGGESVPESGTLTSDMTLQWSDEEEDPCVPSSPVFPEERLAGEHRTPPEHTAPALLGTHTSPAGRHTPFGPQCSGRPKCRRWGPALAPVAMEGAGSDPSAGPGPSHTQGPPDQVLAAHPEQPRGEPVVHYFWGVPFCPQGLDPDLYTQVILAQMEVYEKSLKQAQRGLLRKAEWGDGITPKTEDSFEDSPELIPTISLTRRGLRSRRRPSGGRPPEEEEEEEDGEEGGGKDADQEAQTVAPVEEGEEELDVVGCDVCPETQLSGDETQDLMMDTAAGAETQPGSPSLLKVQSLLRGEGGEGEQREEENLTQDQDKKESEEEGDGGGDSEPLAVMRPSRELIEEEEEEEENEGALEVAAATAAVSSVNCPICQHAFPTAQIEVHAAYCDGEQEVVECADDHSPVAQRPSKRRALKSLATEGRGDNGELSGAAKAPVPQQREKCFVCHKFVPMADFLRHTESCIQRQRTAADASKGDLLSALETTDSRAPGGSSVSVSRASREVIVLSCNDDDDDEEEEDTGESGSAFRVSDSPIRAFRSISEASDCLVDFRRQGAARPPAGQRTRGRGRGGGVKRKFKRR